MSRRGDTVGLEVADALGESQTNDLRDAKRRLWKVIAAALLSRVPVWEKVNFDPSAVGLDRDEPSIVTQVDPDSGVYVAVWWKSGPAATDWTGFGGDSWEQVTVDPSTAGLDRPLTTVVWQTDGGSPAKPLAIWVKSDTGSTSWSRLWPAVIGVGEEAFQTAFEFDFTQYQTQNFTSDGPVTVAGKTINVVNHSYAARFGFNSNPLTTGAHSLRIRSAAGDANMLASNHGPMISVPVMQGLPDDVGFGDVTEWWAWFHVTIPFNILIGSDVSTDITSAPSGDEGAVYGFETFPHSNFFGRAGCIHNDYAQPKQVNGSWTAFKIPFGARNNSLTEVGLHPNFGGDSGLADNASVIALRLTGNAHVEVYSGPWNYGWPSRKDLTLRGHAHLGNPAALAWRDGLADSGALAAFFGLNHGSSGVTTEASLMHMRVQYLLAGASVSAGSSGGGGGGGGTATALKTTGADVVVSEAAPPTDGQVLRATSATTAAWQDETASDGDFTPVTVASGSLAGFGAARNLLVSGTGPVKGIESSGHSRGETISITRDPSESSDLVLNHLDGSATTTKVNGIRQPGGSYSNVHIHPGEEARFRLFTGSASYWKFIGGSA